MRNETLASLDVARLRRIDDMGSALMVNLTCINAEYVHLLTPLLSDTAIGPLGATVLAPGLVRNTGITSLIMFGVFPVLCDMSESHLFQAARLGPVAAATLHQPCPATADHGRPACL